MAPRFGARRQRARLRVESDKEQPGHLHVPRLPRSPVKTPEIAYQNPRVFAVTVTERVELGLEPR